MADESVPIILASASPRRRQLLAEAGYKFTVFPAEIDESAVEPGRMGPCKYAEKLALAKARNVAEKLPDRLIIGADTVVDFDGEIIGKATDEKEAERIIRKLFSAPQKVITAVAVVGVSDGVEIVGSDTTVVYPKRMSDEQIAEHIKSGSWQDKAGAYAIEEGGDEFVERIEGSLTNVMGLPMELLARLLERIA
jgi:septum formation protein